MNYREESGPSVTGRVIQKAAPSNVREARDGLVSEIDRLDKTIAELHARLAPYVISQATFQGLARAGTDAPEPPRSEFANDLRGMVHRLSSIASSVQSLTQNLDI